MDSPVSINVTMTLKRIKLSNIQCHKELDLTLPETGVIAFTGNNSNGKSVITKVLKCLLSNQYQSRPRVRASLINRKAPYGEALFVRSDDASFLLHLTRDAASTYVVLTLPGQEPIRRYLSDKRCSSLCRDFGWHYADERELTLNIAELDETLLFFATSYGCNYDMLETALSDPSAAMSLERLKAVIKEASEIKDVAVAKINASNTVLQTLHIYDTEEEQKRLDTLSFFYNALSKIYFPVIPEVTPVPDIKLCSVYRPRLPRVIYPRLFGIHCNILDILPIARELESLRNEVCPLCGRRFLDNAESTHTVRV